MSREAERVVVILDASRELSLTTIKWALLGGLPLKPGDKLILLAILHQVNNPSTLSFMGAGKFMGYRIKVDSSSIFGTNKKIIAEEMDRRTEQFRKHAEIVKISNKCEREQIEFRIEMQAGSPLKVVASRAAKKLRATWLVLDRHLKSDQRFFIENLTCNIVRMKKDNTVEELRGPNVREINKINPAPRRSNVSYAEMIPETSLSEVKTPRKSRSGQSISSVKEQASEGSEEQHPWHDSSKSITHSASTSSLATSRATSSGYNEYLKSSTHDEEYTTTTGAETGGEHSAQSIYESGDQKDLYSPDETQKQHNHNEDWMGGNPGDEVFKNTVCLTCKNRRPKARPLLKDRNYPDLIDPRIIDSHDVHQLFWMVRVAEKCLSRDPTKRLSMDKVVYALNYIMDCDSICSIRDLSPAQSDTMSRDSCESESQSPYDEDSTFTIETTSVSSLSQFSSARLPPSPSISRISSASTFYYGESASGTATSFDRYIS
ncbi:putative serine-threonine protein kinase, plant-type [Corchorus capsularis]|uniref:Putative serine-threonine protein kinase, plant-type n=1 Tax=Corchorus capsularis TaxID=210143 RepID=A0A1R3FU86_COCAP|nr:putative serine-threonine protein kinase, plant-type [Corchorus capsularis]